MRLTKESAAEGVAMIIGGGCILVMAGCLVAGFIYTLIEGQHWAAAAIGVIILLAAVWWRLPED